MTNNNNGAAPGAGFTLIELLLTLLLSVGLLVLILTAFASTNELARSNTALAESQQSGRISMDQIGRLLRRAGRGGLSGELRTNIGATAESIWTPALAVRSNAGLNGTTQDVLVGFAGSPTAVVGSDIFTVRGALYGTRFLTRPADIALLDGGGAPTTPDLAVNGTIDVFGLSPTFSLPQDLSQLVNALVAPDGTPTTAALLLTAAQDPSIHAVVRLTNVQVIVPGPPLGHVRLQFDINPVDQEMIGYRSLYDAPPTGLPAPLSSVSAVSIVDEVRFFTREAYSVFGDPTSEIRPKLSMIRVRPGSELPLFGNINDSMEDIVENVGSLQVALGFRSNLGPAPTDQNGDGVVTLADEDVDEVDCADVNGDDWLFNCPSDDATDPTWNGPWDPIAGPRLPDLIHVRVSALVRSDRPDPGYDAPRIIRIEDADFDNDPLLSYWNDPNNIEIRFRRQLARTVVEPRNL